MGKLMEKFGSEVSAVWPFQRRAHKLELFEVVDIQQRCEHRAVQLCRKVHHAFAAIIKTEGQLMP